MRVIFVLGLLLALSLGVAGEATAEIELISGATFAWLCNDGPRTTKVGKKLFRMPICVVLPEGPADPPCPPEMENITIALWGDDEPVTRAIEIRIYRFRRGGELVKKITTSARQENGRLVASLRPPRQMESGERLEATFVLPRRVRRLEPGKCLEFYANPSRRVNP